MNQTQPLLLDLTSPLPAFTNADVRQWAAGRKIFISSTMIDLQPERKQVAEAIREIGGDPRYFEGFSSSGDPASIYVPEVNRADLVILLLGERYGQPLVNMGNRSATHVEYDAAAEALKPLLIYRKEDTGLTREPQLESFIRQLDAKHVVARFHSLEQLDSLVREGLHRRAQADSLEWVKLGRAVFPASDWHFSGSVVRIHSATRDPAIIGYLKELGNGFQQREVLVFGTQALLTLKVGLQEEGRGRYQRELVLEIEVQRDQFGSPHKFTPHTFTQFGSMNGVPAHELVRTYVRSMLFNTPMPKQAGLWLGRRETERPTFYLPDLYDQLKDHQRVDELFPSLGRIYLVDRLIRGVGQEGGVTHDIHRLELSPVYDGRTYLYLEYVIANQYGGESLVDKVEGFIELEQTRVRQPVKDWD